MSLRSKIQNLINASNDTTGEPSTDLTSAVQNLIDGYGGGSGTRYTITWSLDNATAMPQSTKILEGRTLTSAITPSDGYNIQNVVVLMGNVDITATAWNATNERITIANVSDNISISVATKGGYAAGRLLLWEDDFDTLDTDTWGYELGYIRNGEKQYFTSDSKNCYVEDSVLHLVALKDNPTPEFEWSSASIDSSYNFPNGHGFSYGNGLIETKIKIPLTSAGVWPAWWSVGVIKAATCESGTYVRHGLSWPNATEIDMLDYIGSSAVSNNIEPGVIYQNNPYSISAVTPSKTPIVNDGKYNLSDGDWHIIGMEYTPNELRFYQDRVLISKIDISAIDNLHGNFAYPLKYNLAMGATSGTIPSELTRAEYLVDWVRYYAPEGTRRADIVELTASIDNYPNALNKNRAVPIYPSYTGVSENLFLRWQSSDTTVATVYNGYLQTLANGDFTLSAYDDDGNEVFSRQINVADNNVVPVTYFDITTDLTEIPAEETITVNINVLPTYATNLTAIVSCSNQYLVCNGNQITNINDTGSSVTAIVHVTTADGGHSEDVSVRIASAKNYNMSDTTNILNNYTPKTFTFSNGSTKQHWSWTDALQNGNALSYSGSYSFPQGTSAGLYSPGTTMGAGTGVKKISDSYTGSLTLFMLIKKPEDSTSYNGPVMSLFSGQGYTASSATRFSGGNNVYALNVSDMTGAYIVLCAKSTYVEGAETNPWRFGVKVNDEEVVWTDGSIGSYYTTGGGSTGATPYGTYYGIGNTVNAIAKEIYYKQIVAYSSIKTDSECESIMNELYTIHSS